MQKVSLINLSMRIDIFNAHNYISIDLSWNILGTMAIFHAIKWKKMR